MKLSKPMIALMSSMIEQPQYMTSRHYEKPNVCDALLLRGMIKVVSKKSDRRSDPVRYQLTPEGVRAWGKATGNLIDDSDTRPPIEAAPAVPLTALQEAHRLGFLRAVGWMQRDDLMAAVEGGTYRKDRDHDLAGLDGKER